MAFVQSRHRTVKPTYVGMGTFWAQTWAQRVSCRGTNAARAAGAPSSDGAYNRLSAAVLLSASRLTCHSIRVRWATVSSIRIQPPYSTSRVSRTAISGESTVRARSATERAENVRRRRSLVQEGTKRWALFIRGGE